MGGVADAEQAGFVPPMKAVDPGVKDPDVVPGVQGVDRGLRDKGGDLGTE